MKRVFKVSEGVEGSQFLVVTDGALNIRATLAELLEADVDELRINWAKDVTEDLLDPKLPTVTIQSLLDILNGDVDCIITQYNGTYRDSTQRMRPVWEIVEAAGAE